MDISIVYRYKVSDFNWAAGVPDKVYFGKTKIGNVQGGGDIEEKGLRIIRLRIGQQYTSLDK